MEEKERYIFGQRILYDNEKEVVCFDGFNLDEFMGIITNILNKQDKRIKELEQENLSLQEQSIRDNQNWIEETTQLKQQLAEKTLTIEQINKAFIENRSLWKGKYEQSNQDKISFALEQLEKVKEYTDDVWWVDGVSEVVCNFIDNQIKQLKGEE